MGYKVGDFVRLKVEKDSNGWFLLVSRSATFPPYEKNCFYEKAQICGCYQMSSDDYIVLCDFDPHSYFSFVIDPWHQKGYDVTDIFLGMRGAFISSEHIWPVQAPAPVEQIVLHHPGGMACKLCKKFIQYAGVNRDDDTFVCKRCRDTKGYMLKCNTLSKA